MLYAPTSGRRPRRATAATAAASTSSSRRTDRSPRSSPARPTTRSSPTSACSTCSTAATSPRSAPIRSWLRVHSIAVIRLVVAQGVEPDRRHLVDGEPPGDGHATGGIGNAVRQLRAGVAARHAARERGRDSCRQEGHVERQRAERGRAVPQLRHDARSGCCRLLQPHRWRRICNEHIQVFLFQACRFESACAA